MSIVTSLVIAASTGALVSLDGTESAAFRTVQTWVHRETHGYTFGIASKPGTPLSIAGGSKVVQGDLAIAAFNMFDLNGLLDVLRRAPWREADDVLLLVSREYDNGWEPIRIREYQW